MGGLRISAVRMLSQRRNQSHRDRSRPLRCRTWTSLSIGDFHLGSAPRFGSNIDLSVATRSSRARRRRWYRRWVRLQRTSRRTRDDPPHSKQWPKVAYQLTPGRRIQAESDQNRGRARWGARRVSQTPCVWLSSPAVPGDPRSAASTRWCCVSGIRHWDSVYLNRHLVFRFSDRGRVGWLGGFGRVCGVVGLRSIAMFTQTI